MAQWCTSWHDHPRPCVRTPGTTSRDIMCLLVGVVAKVQAPRWVVCQRLVFSSSFCGCGSSNLEPPTMGIAVALLSIAAAIPLRWWRMRLVRKPTTPSVDLHGRLLIGRPIMLPIWPPPWRLRIFVGIRRCQREPSARCHFV